MKRIVSTFSLLVLVSWFVSSMNTESETVPEFVRLVNLPVVTNPATSSKEAIVRAFPITEGYSFCPVTLPVSCDTRCCPSVKYCTEELLSSCEDLLLVMERKVDAHEIPTNLFNPQTPWDWLVVFVAILFLSWIVGCICCVMYTTEVFCNVCCNATGDAVCWGFVLGLVIAGLVLWHN